MAWKSLHGSASPSFVQSIQIYLTHLERLSNFMDEISLSGGGCKVSKIFFYDV